MRYKGRAVVDIRRESRPEVLRQVAQLLDSENRRLRARLQDATTKLLQLENASPEKLQRELIKLEELVSAQRHALFGPSSERPAGRSLSERRRPRWVRAGPWPWLLGTPMPTVEDSSSSSRR